jgi:pSer/pThr/pTyr-binding forkhead associated (FHA) protein
MPRLLGKSDVVRDQILELKLGVNRFGRGPENNFRIEHPTVSVNHCEITLSGDGVTVRDCGSTNGTHIDGVTVQEGRLESGQTLHIGHVEFLVEAAEVVVSIPKFDGPRPPAPPVVLKDGSMICTRHPNARVTFRCKHCREVMCDACVHRLRRRGGKTLFLCFLCSHQCERIVEEKKKKNAVIAFLQDTFLHSTVKLPFMRSKGKEE